MTDARIEDKRTDDRDKKKGRQGNRPVPGRRRTDKEKK